ncbi:hypothetical protein Pen02_34610 [Plantactinospora endophytica]|uniref:Uncharacterized protein n=1 Tax=Plantactinospora endophytica TaxID=673535 RepID=A0ABQ4E1C7_9ACTN|nr:hypothetical protein Pen02_34610 [Plantactinospora endophytica]
MLAENPGRRHRDRPVRCGGRARREHRTGGGTGPVPPPSRPLPSESYGNYRYLELQLSVGAAFVPLHEPLNPKLVEALALNAPL